MHRNGEVGAKEVSNGETRMIGVKRHAVSQSNFSKLAMRTIIAAHRAHNAPMDAVARTNCATQSASQQILRTYTRLG